MTPELAMVRPAASGDYSAMKHLLALALLTLPALVAAGETCTGSSIDRIEVVRVHTVRAHTIESMQPWQRSFLFDPQIL
ncbi:MAG: hypothetical protein M3Q83_03540 [Pseudomonadota bacterium]|nr:hypothetical protein [Pseudomonadota bacterium]